MTQQNILEQAKQGNAQAIAALMNRTLQPKGITAKASLKDGCLWVFLEAEQVPDEQKMLAFIRAGMEALDAASIAAVQVVGKQRGTESPAWGQRIELAKPGAASEKAAPKTATQATPQQPTASSAIKKSPSRAETVLGFVVLVFVFGGCVYGAGKPWNCEQAREAVREAQRSFAHCAVKV